MTKLIDINNLSEKELQEALQKKQGEKREQEKLARTTYETQRDLLVKNLVTEAVNLNKKMAAFKGKALTLLDEFRDTAYKYGDVRSNSKGGFALRNTEQSMRVSYDRNSKSEYDERANLAEDLLKEFLTDKVKKRDQKAYRLVTSLLTRNKATGDYNPVSINSLLAIEDNYDDQRWKKAMKLFKESYNNILISMSVSFFIKDELDKDLPVPLTFASL